jgi:hypothetical protein
MLEEYTGNIKIWLKFHEMQKKGTGRQGREINLPNLFPH